MSLEPLRQRTMADKSGGSSGGADLANRGDRSKCSVRLRRNGRKQLSATRGWDSLPECNPQRMRRGGTISIDPRLRWISRRGQVTWAEADVVLISGSVAALLPQDEAKSALYLQVRPISLGRSGPNLLGIILLAGQKKGIFWATLIL